MAFRTPITTYLLITLLTVTVRGVPSDESDDDCKTRPCRAGYFCYKETDRCAPCIDCASRFRQNHSNGWCHQKASDCGECLPGYMEQPLEHDVPKESCMPQPPWVITTSKTSSSQPENEHVINYVMLMSAVSVLGVLFMASFLYRWHKERRVPPPQEATELQELVTQQPPPPYSPFAYKPPADAAVSPEPTAPSLESSTVQIDSPRDCETNIFVEARHWPPARETSQLVQANLHNTPNWVNTSNYRPDTPPSPTPSASEDSGDGTFAIHDENTQESHWTPNTSQEDVEESGNQGANPGSYVGSTAVGTVDAPCETPDDETCQDIRDNRRGRRASSGDLAASQESEEAPRPKRMRSESPPAARTFTTINNNTISHSGVNQFNLLQINLHLNQVDDRREQDHNSNALVDSEDFA